VLAAVQYAPSELVFVNVFMDMYDYIKYSVMDAQIWKDACGYQRDFHVLGLPKVETSSHSADSSVPIPLREMLH